MGNVNYIERTNNKCFTEKRIQTIYETTKTKVIQVNNYGSKESSQLQSWVSLINNIFIQPKHFIWSPLPSQIFLENHCNKYNTLNSANYNWFIATTQFQLSVMTSQLTTTMIFVIFAEVISTLSHGFQLMCEPISGTFGWKQSKFYMTTAVPARLDVVLEPTEATLCSRVFWRKCYTCDENKICVSSVPDNCTRLQPHKIGLYPEPQSKRGSTFKTTFRLHQEI